VSDPSEIDYATSGLDIQYAVLDQYKRIPDKPKRPDFILWDGRKIKGFDNWTVPGKGLVRIELIEAKGDIEQGADVKIDDGFLTLIDGREVPLLRTWFDARYEDVVEYPYLARMGRLGVNNVFRRRWPNGQSTEEKWTGNAGFWVEEISPLDRVYHCSHGAAPIPDFSLFTFRVTVSGLPGTAV